MSEKTLKEVGKEATKHYGSHELRAGMLANAKTRNRQANDEQSWQYFFSTKTQQEAQSATQKSVDLEKQAYHEDIKSGAEFAKDNAEQLHDLAVLEAHIGGVAINVEQPVVAGQKIEVHKS